MLVCVKENLKQIVIVLIILCQNAIWPIWRSGDLISYILVIYLFLTSMRTVISKTTRQLVFLLCFLFLIFIIIPMFTGLYLSNIIYLLCFWISFSVSNYDYDKAFNLLSKIYATILLFSFIPWFINSFIVEIFPTIGMLDISDIKGSDSYIMRNYFFYVAYDSADYNRFYSMFNEPGVVGTLSSFILFGLRYNIRTKLFWIIFIPSFFTYSMAFYVLSVVSLLYFMFTRRQFTSLFFVVIFLFVGFIFFGTNESFQQSVLNRITISDMDDNFDSRTSYAASFLYDSILWTKDFFFGLGKIKSEQMFAIHGASYKVFIVQRGFLALVGLYFMFLSFIKYRKYKSLDSYMLLFIFILSFLQRPYAFTAWQMLLFCCILSHLAYSSSKKVMINN